MTIAIAETPNLALVAMMMAGVVVGLFIMAALWANRYVKVGPNQVLIISGRKRSFVDPNGKRFELGCRVVKGGGTFVWPMIERVDVLSLELQELDVKAMEVSTADGVEIGITGAAQAKVNGDDHSIARAMENFLGQGAEGVKRAVIHTVDSQLRQVVGKLPAAACRKDRVSITEQVGNSARIELAKLGVSLVSFSIHTIETQSESNLDTTAAT